MRVALLLLVLLTGCASVPDPGEGASFVIVRHAEKADDDSRDPSLTLEGERRAERLASAMRHEPLVAVYATPLRRTQATAAPSALAAGLPVTPYDASTPAADFARRLRTTHAAGTVLIVGHSNTVPDIAAALCDCVIAPIPDSEYGRRIRIRVNPDGRVTVDDRREP